MKRLINSLSYTVLLFLAISTGTVFSQSVQYKIAGKIIIGGESRWDYLSVDQSTNRLYTSHASKVHVIDLSSDKVIGEIADLSGVHGMAFAPEFNKGFISNRDGQITVFDLKTFKKTGNIKIDQKNPDAIIFDTATKKIFTMNHSNNSVTAIDPLKESVIATVAVEGVPEAAVTDNKGRLFVNLEDKSAIQVIDVRTMKVTAKWSIAPVESPTGMAIDLKTNRLFTVGDNKMAVVDITSGKVVAIVPIGAGCDGCVFDPQSNLLFSSNGDGTMTIVKEENPNKFTVLSNVTTAKGARTIALDLKTQRVFTLAVLEDKAPASKSYGVLILDNK